MALNKKGFDWKAIRKDQRAIDKLPNRGLAQVDHGAKSKALEKRKGGKKKSRTGKSDGRMFSRPDTPMKRSETLRFLQGGAGEHRDL